MRPLKVLIIPDKFKGTLTASQAAEAISRGWKAARPGDILTLVPMSDGGDGFGEIIRGLLKAKPEPAKAVDAAHRPLESVWWWQARERTAVIEAAQVNGLAQLPPGKYHPFELDTAGVGMLLQAARKKKARRCLVGIGGSATNDGGFGMATALGWQFFNAHAEKIDRWTELHTLSQIRPPDDVKLFDELIVAVDVQNPLLGSKGCTRVYGPQKGLRPRDFPFAEKCLQRLAEILEKELHLTGVDEPGAGAAGGLGFGLRCFAGARLVPGFQIFMQQAAVSTQLEDVDLVITGEGAIDDSTVMGKGVGEIAHLCKARGVACLGLAGTSPREAQTPDPFSSLAAIVPRLTTSDEALREPALWLERLAQQRAERWARPN